MIVYYVEVNAICVIFLALLRFPLRSENTTSSEQRTLFLMMLSTAAFCLSDMAAGIFRGMLFPGAKALIEFSNGLYFEMLVVISYLWYVYAHTRFHPDELITRKMLLKAALPALGFTLVVLTNPLTHFLYTITADNLYRRGNGVFLHWLIVWTYFLVPSLKALTLYFKETSSLKKQELMPLLLFAVPPFLASMIQMVFYGVTTTQVGITVSIAMICLKSRESQILTDALTGINNRRAFNSFMENQMQHNKGATYTLMMIDVNHFKLINDKYGHMMGDLVLKKIALALKEACKVVTTRVHLSRFGGDEFVILGIDFSEDDADLLRRAIADELKNEIARNIIPCDVSVSIGTTSGRCTQEKEFKELLGRADQAMYEEKAHRPAPAR